MSLSDDICNACAYLDFSKSYALYREYYDSRGEHFDLCEWKKLEQAYGTISLYLSDSAIIDAKDLVLSEYP